MAVTVEQVVGLAPDPASAAAGRKLAAVKNWKELGQTTAALWGKCQGSAVYQVKIELASLGYHCSCPSRKFPCKHVIALLLLYAQTPETMLPGDPPEWVAEWLQKRQAKAEKREAAASGEAAADDPKAAAAKAKATQKTKEQRAGRVSAGIERLELWLKDLIRGGLASIEQRDLSFWDEQARRLVDAQAPGLAARLTKLAEIPRATPVWPAKLLGELGRVQLLLHAYKRLDQLDPALQSEVRQLIGWNVSQPELEQQGERLRDRWAIMGQRTEDDDRLRVQRTWLWGRQSGRTALILQFAVNRQPFAEAIMPGVEQDATLLFYPGASGQRAKIALRESEPVGISERLPGCATLETMLDEMATLWARFPWLLQQACVLHEVTVLPPTATAGAAGSWRVRDKTGAALPLADHTLAGGAAPISAGWTVQALSGGKMFDLVAEWDGERLRPLAFWLAGSYRGL